jgi:hypothetical protein
MVNAGNQDSGSLVTTDLWKFCEERAAQQKASVYQLVTWITGFAAVVLGFAVKEGYEWTFHDSPSSFAFDFRACRPVVLFLAVIISGITAGILTGRMGAPTQRETVSALLQKIWEAAKI